MSALPPQVRKQIDQANEIISAVYPPQPNPDDEQENTEAQAKPEATTKEPEKKADAPEKKAPDASEMDDAAKAEHKYKVLQGKYNAEVPTLKRRLDEATDENRELKQRILNVEGMLSAMQTRDAPPKDDKPVLPDISDDERAQFGDDLIDLMERVARRATLPEIEAQLKPLAGRMKQVGEKVANTESSVAQSKREQVLDRLATAVPNWEQQNVDPKFLEWLDQEDGMSGKPRGNFLAEAMKRNDAQTVIKYFKGFQSENTADTSQPAPTETQETESQKSEPQAKLDDFVAPGTPQTGTASAPDESGKRVWTRADIAKFYNDKNEFVKKGRPLPKRMVELERDIFKAQSEGRLR